MSGFLTTILGDKKEWKAMEARANALPQDYRTVYREMKSYLWKLTAGDGRDVVAILKDVLGLFETSSAQGQNVLDVTGQDVAAFCDQRLPRPTTYLDSWRSSLNRNVATKLPQ